jgi:hypothetical protein
MEDPNDPVARKLDEVIGTEYDAGERGLLAKLRGGIVRWIVAALLAVAMVALIAWTIESHRLPPEGAKPAPKPVQVQILPADATSKR